jgi:hypothetical protein
MYADQLSARAHLKIQHHRPYFDAEKGLWLQRLLDEDEAKNIITDAGRRLIHTLVYGTSAQKTTASAGVGLNYIGLSNDGTSPAAGDTALTGEISGNGLTRALGTVTLPTGSGTITTISRVFTYSGGGTQSVQKAALFDAASSGNMAHELLFTQRTLATSDTLTLTFNITLT